MSTTAAVLASDSIVSTPPVACELEVKEPKAKRRKNRSTAPARATTVKTEAADDQLYCLCKTPYDESKSVFEEIVMQAGSGATMGLGARGQGQIFVYLMHSTYTFAFFIFLTTKIILDDLFWSSTKNF